jgi:hypothetical protein
MTSRRKRWIAVGVALLVALAVGKLLYRPFPSDRTPAGAYMRIAKSVTGDREKEMFPYLETDAQWACYTIREMRKRAHDRVATSYPEPERTTLMNAYREPAEAGDGSDVFAQIAAARGWRARLRRDLSGVAATDTQGERASVVTARGTRYPFRRRENGIWGLTIFTADLTAEADKASRDFDMVSRAADDYDRSNGKHP